MVKPSPPSKGPSFFRVMQGDFSSTLSIPILFSKHLTEKLGVKSVVRVPGGRKWRVKVGRSAAAGCWYFQSGWEKFVKDHFISVGDVLVFYYDGDFTFDVKVYGDTGCEKEEASPAANSSTPAKKKPKTIRRPGNPLCIGRSSGGLIWLNRPPLNVRSNRRFQKAIAFKPSNPHFVAVFSTSRQYLLTIPVALAKEFELAKKGFVILEDPASKTWRVKVTCEKNGRVFLTAGWINFHRCNSLEHGDACCFEFIQGGDLVRVHLFRIKRFNEEISSRRKKQVKEESAESMSKDGRLNQWNTPPLNAKRNRAFWEAIAFKPPNPHFVAVCRFTRRYDMKIPIALAKELELAKIGLVILEDPMSRTWRVKVYCEKNGRVSLTAGWASFQKGNSLEDGDACCFEFIRGSDLVRVHLFRRKEVKNKVKEESVELMSDDDESIELMDRPRTEIDPGKVLKTLESFKLEHPFFIYLCTLSAKSSVRIPRMLARELALTMQNKLTLYDPRGVSWPVEICQENKQTYLGIGWKEFYGENNLMDGDVCIFEFVDAAVRVNILRVKQVVATAATKIKEEALS